MAYIYLTILGHRIILGNDDRGCFDITRAPPETSINPTLSTCALATRLRHERVAWAVWVLPPRYRCEWRHATLISSLSECYIHMLLLYHPYIRACSALETPLQSAKQITILLTSNRAGARDAEFLVSLWYCGLL
jgi:hypothetical protein